MADDERQANLEFWAGRGRTAAAREEPDRPLRSFGGSSGRWRSLRIPRLSRLRFPKFGRPSFARPARAWPSFALPVFARGGDGREPDAPRWRARPIAAAALLAGLAAAWLFVGHRSHASAEAELPAPPAPAAILNGTAPVPRSPSPSASTSAPSTTVVPRTADCRGLSTTRAAVRCTVDGVELEVRLYAPGTAAEAYTVASGAVARPASGAPACARGLPDERSWSAGSSPTVAIGRYRCRLEQGRAAMWWTRGDRLTHALAPNGDLASLFAWWRAHPSE